MDKILEYVKAHKAELIRNGSVVLGVIIGAVVAGIFESKSNSTDFVESAEVETEE